MSIRSYAVAGTTVIVTKRRLRIPLRMRFSSSTRYRKRPKDWMAFCANSRVKSLHYGARGQLSGWRMEKTGRLCCSRLRTNGETGALNPNPHQEPCQGMHAVGQNQGQSPTGRRRQGASGISECKHQSAKWRTRRRGRRLTAYGIRPDGAGRLQIGGAVLPCGVDKCSVPCSPRLEI